MTVAIPASGIPYTVGPDGNIVLGAMTLDVHFDVSPTWLELALEHLAVAKRREGERNAAWTGSDEDLKASTLEREFEASMQAIVAAAIAIDAFYSSVRKKAEVPEELVTTWRQNRTSRPVQVAEVLRIAFGLAGSGFDALRENLQEIYRYRDLATHPSGDIKPAILHSELGVGVEWRFQYFRHANADLAVKTTMRILSELATFGKPKNEAVHLYAEMLRQRLEQMGIVTRQVDDEPADASAEQRQA